LHAASIVLRQVRFSFADLAKYRDIVHNQLGEDDWVWSDLDEVNNRVTFGVTSPVAASHIATIAQASRLPAEAVGTHLVAKPRLIGDLNNYHDTLAGGLQLGFTNGGACTLGFLISALGHLPLHDDGRPLHPADGLGRYVFLGCTGVQLDEACAGICRSSVLRYIWLPQRPHVPKLRRSGLYLDRYIADIWPWIDSHAFGSRFAVGWRKLRPVRSLRLFQHHW